MRRMILLLMGLSLLGGCPSSPSTIVIDLSSPTGLDGNWRITGPAGSAADCVTVRDGQIVARDGGCDGSQDVIVASTPASISGDRIVWSFATVLSAGTIPFALDVTLQSDGRLIGTVSVTDLSAGGLNSSDVVMTRE